MSPETNQPTVAPQPAAAPPPPSFDQAPAPKPKKSKKKFLVIVLVVLLIAAVAAGGWWYGQNQAKASAEQEITELQSQIDQLKKENSETKAVDEETASSAAQSTKFEDELFSLMVPAGFTQVNSGRIFTFAGPSKETFSFKNNQTGQYFEVNVGLSETGSDPDYSWYYTYQNGTVTLSKPTTTVCKKDAFCSGGNGRLDVNIGNKEGTMIKGQAYYFTFGNTETEQVTDLTFVDSFINSIEFK